MQKIYVITNSHMDPIWLWRLREGRAAWINTCRTVVRMMKKYPFLKFARSSSICYRWIEECDKSLFREIVRLVDAVRWELVGGWVEQSDTIITPGESLIRQAEHAPNPPNGEEGYAGLGTTYHTFWVFSGEYSTAQCAHLARERLWSAEHFEITASKGNPRFRYDRWEIIPEEVAVQSERILPDGSAAFSLLNQSGKTVTAELLRNGTVLKKVKLKPGELSLVSFPVK